MKRRSFIKGSMFFSASALLWSKLPSSGLFLDDYEEMKCSKILRSFDASLKNLPMGELIGEVGKSFIGTEYVAGTLDESRTENLVIMVTGLDCVTFVENALIMARLIKKGKTDIEDYKQELEYIRYRGGVMDGYPSRLHYFTDWITDNEIKGVVRDITHDIGGVPYSKEIDFMTTHIDSYKQLKGNDAYIQQMKEVESIINSRNKYYIPKKEVDNFYESLQTGDIIATTTDIAGLDVTHTGYIYKDSSGTHFFHANVKTKEVMISNEQLKEYLSGNKKQTGVIVARPQEV